MCISNYHCQLPSYFQNPFCWTLQVSSSKAPTIWNDFKQATAHKGSWIPSTMNDMFTSTAAHFKWQNAGTGIQQSHNVIAPLPIALIKIVPMPSTPHFTCCNVMAVQVTIAWDYGILLKTLQSLLHCPAFHIHVNQAIANKDVRLGPIFNDLLMVYLPFSTATTLGHAFNTRTKVKQFGHTPFCFIFPNNSHVYCPC